MSRRLAALALLVCASPAAAQNIRAVEVNYPTTGMNAGHRVLRAYPNIPFSYTIGAIGGTNTFTYSLTGAPAWMSVRNAGAGETCSRAYARAATAAGLTLTWVRCGEVFGTPMDTTTDDDASYTVTACDADNDCDSSAGLSIDVTTTGFKFVATTGNNGNAGTLASPFLNMLAIEDPAKVDATDIVYWRTGTYTVQCVGVADQDAGIPEEARCEFNDGDGTPEQWVAYPGETVTLDHGYDGTGEDGARRITFISPHNWFEGFIVDNCEAMCLQLGNEDEGTTVRNSTFLGLLRGLNGTNSAHVMTIGGTTPTVQIAMQIEGNDFGTIVGDPTDPAGAHVKWYSVLDALSANNLYHDSPYEGLAIKESVSGFTSRFDSFYANTGNAIHGNMACNAATHCTYGEIAYDLVIASGSGFTLDINQHGQTGPVDIYRNTLVGPMRVNATTSDDGVFAWRQNVVVNAQGANTIPYVTTSGSVDASRVTSTNDLRGNVAAAIVDAFGLLQGSYATDNGPESANPRGFQFDADAGGGGGSPVQRYRGPPSLRIRVAN